jgi:hypothetical protein
MQTYPPTIPIERSYFSVYAGKVATHGSINPVDSKDAAGPLFMLIGVLDDGGKWPVLLAADSRREAVEESSGLISADDKLTEGFICELFGSTGDGRSVYRSFALIETHKPSHKTENA